MFLGGKILYENCQKGFHEILLQYWQCFMNSFSRNVISGSEFYNMLSFLHCCNNAEYSRKCGPSYDSGKKLGKVSIILQERFSYLKFPN